MSHSTAFNFSTTLNQTSKKECLGCIKEFNSEHDGLHFKENHFLAEGLDRIELWCEAKCIGLVSFRVNVGEPNKEIPGVGVELHIEGVIILKEFRGKGLSWYLLDKLIDVFCEKYEDFLTEKGDQARLLVHAQPYSDEGQAFVSNLSDSMAAIFEEVGVEVIELNEV
ncbi:hypothetical protein CYL31_18670 [Marinomonas sp. A3A]|uniref:GNAT family N-acetyltransferase n=1 Tax=Marinomonas sp. A3A TaxID=2065312 RepID=UPI001BB44099|nr:GNAT family N-acetyltransferase [Marinomonas sp. A3A]QUX93300.1 hypothetical protein CYL31_18670 [Marinomonas sp. A3A]